MRKRKFEKLRNGRIEKEKIVTEFKIMKNGRTEK